MMSTEVPSASVGGKPMLRKSQSNGPDTQPLQSNETAPQGSNTGAPDEGPKRGRRPSGKLVRSNSGKFRARSKSRTRMATDQDNKKSSPGANNGPGNNGRPARRPSDNNLLDDFVDLMSQHEEKSNSCSNIENVQSSREREEQANPTTRRVMKKTNSSRSLSRMERNIAGNAPSEKKVVEKKGNPAIGRSLSARRMGADGEDDNKSVKSQRRPVGRTQSESRRVVRQNSFRSMQASSSSSMDLEQDDGSSTRDGPSSPKENQTDQEKISDLEAKVTLYKEQYKRAMREKKQAQTRLATESAAKDSAADALRQQIQKLKAENAKLRTGAVNNSKGPFQQLPLPSSTKSCDVWHGTGMLLTGQHRPRPSVFHLPGLRSIPFWTQATCGKQTEVAYREPSLTWAVQHFEEKAEAITDEFKRVAPFLASDFNRTQEAGRVAPDGAWDWHSYTLEGTQNDLFVQHFPQTSDILQAVSSKGLLFERLPFAHCFFSTLHACSKLAPHTSAMNLRLRLLLPLMVPNNGKSASPQSDKPLSGIRVGGTTRSFKQGQVLLIDDSYDHEQWNEEEAGVAMLVVDLWHPDVSTQERAELVSLFDPDQQNQW